jgi:ABC-type nitrate/sulfonate/bicarbonate transport system substrate-binding protein
MKPYKAAVWLVAVVAVALCHGARAEDTLKLAIGQRGNWENAPPELGQKAGFFKKRGLNLELLYTQGAGETLQAVISGSVDVGLGVGTAGVLGAFAKGAPVRAIANSTTGADDLFWYVPSSSQARPSPIRPTGRRPTSRSWPSSGNSALRQNRSPPEARPPPSRKR